MPAILSKVRDDVVKAYAKVPAPALCACAAGAITLGLVSYKLLQHQPQNNNQIMRSCTNGAKHINNNYEKALLVKCKTPTTCSAKIEKEKCESCKSANADFENDQNPLDSDPDDEAGAKIKILKTLGARVPGLNRQFMKEFLVLIKIMVPKWYSKEVALLSAHTLCLFTRTFLSIYVAALEGSLVKYIVKKDVRSFSLMLLKWFGIAIPATFINSMIRYLENKLAVAFR